MQLSWIFTEVRYPLEAESGREEAHLPSISPSEGWLAAIQELTAESSQWELPWSHKDNSAK